MASHYRPLSDGDLRRVAEAAFEVLEKKGMAVYSPTAFDALKDAGAAADAETRTVRMPRSMVEDAIATNPSSITLWARDPAYHAVLEKNRVHYGTGGTALYVLDPDTGERREATVPDVILNARMVQALEYIHLFTINVFPHDVVELDSIDVNRFFHALDNTTKHVMGGLYSLNGCKKAVELAEMVAGSPEKLREEPFVSFITLIISPFKIDKHYGEMTCYLAERGLPVVVPTEPICGTTSPITLASNVLSHIAETLGGITIVQSVRKGAPGICGSVGSITNLNTMDHVSGAVERGMIHAAVSQLAQHFGVPLYSTAGCSDAKEVGVQSAYESAIMSLLVAMSGANYIHDIAGLMESDLTVSYDKLVIDNEILGMCQRVLRGIEVTDDTLALDLILGKAPGEDYLAEFHTVEHMRTEFFMPRLSNRDRRDAYDVLHSTAAGARAFVEQVRAGAPPSCIDGALREQILKRFPEIHP
ncbi:MAG: trimethylamine methyltransferase family protein [Candidatus Latescibacteria bacterium]|jgi:trimethylamine--corrinoid protein Co-methyltransferase|nr:trimethylamine methyltransferase family protein [Candidatus Latescibacterota bacterium]